MLSSAYALSSFSFLAVALLTPLLIWGLRALRWTQPIRKELPADHQAKRGTPLMAGLILLTGVAMAMSFHPRPLTNFLGMTFLSFSAIGFLDDFKKAHYQDPSGISSRTKLLCQFAAVGVLLIWIFAQSDASPDLVLFRDIRLPLPTPVYMAAVALFIVGSANAINFTDGLDGLLINTAIPTYFFFFLITDRPEVKTFTLIMIGCLLGLLIYNIHPAKAFMGDTGSLAIGGSLSFLAVLEKVEILIPLLFSVYLAEQFSVILQVWYFKRTRLRIFRMTPIHFHFSLKYGWSENRIVMIFGLASWASALLSWLYWKFCM